MNNDLKGQIIARLDKVHEGTKHIYSDKFYFEFIVKIKMIYIIIKSHYKTLK